MATVPTSRTSALNQRGSASGRPVQQPAHAAPRRRGRRAVPVPRAASATIVRRATARKVIGPRATVRKATARPRPSAIRPWPRARRLAPRPGPGGPRGARPARPGPGSPATPEIQRATRQAPRPGGDVGRKPDDEDDRAQGRGRAGKAVSRAKGAPQRREGRLTIQAVAGDERCRRPDALAGLGPPGPRTREGKAPAAARRRGRASAAKSSFPTSSPCRSCPTGWPCAASRSSSS